MRRPTSVLSVWVMSAALLALTPAHAQETSEPERPLLAPDAGADQNTTLRVTPAPEGTASDAEPSEGEGPVSVEGEGGLTGQAVQESLPPPPTEQGTRPPDTLDEEDVPELYELLSRVRMSPPSLEGEPVQRPNALASEPAKEMEPQQPEDVSLFVEDYIE